MIARVKVAVVGPCASGKSTLCEALRGLGYDAYGVGQEHSDIADLWQRRCPDFVIALTVSLEEIRRRRNEPGWRKEVYVAQLSRLETAYSEASIIIETSSRTAEGVLAMALLAIEQASIQHERRTGQRWLAGDADV